MQQVSLPQQTYQQPVFVSCQPGQGAMAMAGMQPCYSLLPPNQHTTMRYHVQSPRHVARATEKKSYPHFMTLGIFKVSKGG